MFWGKCVFLAIALLNVLEEDSLNDKPVGLFFSFSPPHLVFLKTIFLPPWSPAPRYVESHNKWPTNGRHLANVWRGGWGTERQTLKGERVEDHFATLKGCCFSVCTICLHSRAHLDRCVIRVGSTTRLSGLVRRFFFFGVDPLAKERDDKRDSLIWRQFCCTNSESAAMEWAAAQTLLNLWRTFRPARLRLLRVSASAVAPVMYG